MADIAQYGTNIEVIPAGSANGLLKRNAANNGWEFKTAAQLGIAASVLQTQFAELTLDTSIASAAFVDVLSLAITTVAASNLLITITGSASNTSANQNMDIQLVIDGTPVRGSGTRVSTANVPQNLGIAYRKAGMSAGAHTLKIQWRTGGGTMRIRPATTLNEHLSLLVMESTV